MPERDPRERLAMLEEERDTLRERLASFERGEPDTAYRNELTRLEEQYEKLRRENEELRQRIHDARKRRHFDGAVFEATDEALRDLWRRIIGQ